MKSKLFAMPLMVGMLVMGGLIASLGAANASSLVLAEPMAWYSVDVVDGQSALLEDQNAVETDPSTLGPPAYAMTMTKSTYTMLATTEVQKLRDPDHGSAARPERTCRSTPS